MVASFRPTRNPACSRSALTTDHRSLFADSPPSTLRRATGHSTARPSSSSMPEHLPATSRMIVLSGGPRQGGQGVLPGLVADAQSLGLREPRCAGADGELAREHVLQRMEHALLDRARCGDLGLLADEAREEAPEGVERAPREEVALVGIGRLVAEEGHAAALRHQPD